jgi:hypothetical protein
MTCALWIFFVTLAGMSKSITSFQAVINSWPMVEKPANGRAAKPQQRRYGGSIQAFADDMGMPYTRAQLMFHRNSINPRYWPKLVEQARIRGIRGVTTALLTRLYEARWNDEAAA